jgi:predicted Kef-type K+ transport protein
MWLRRLFCCISLRACAVNSLHRGGAACGTLAAALTCFDGRRQAGLLIAETEFALQVESDIAPYKGLLMGLFFMTVGMEISAGLFVAKLRTVLAAIAVLLIGKARGGSRGKVQVESAPG